MNLFCSVVVSSKSSGNAVDDVAVLDQKNNFSLQKTISTIEQRLDTTSSRDAAENAFYADENIMPSVANEMGAGQSQ